MSWSERDRDAAEKFVREWIDERASFLPSEPASRAVVVRDALTFLLLRTRDDERRATEDLIAAAERFVDCLAKIPELDALESTQGPLRKAVANLRGRRRRPSTTRRGRRQEHE